MSRTDPSSIFRPMQRGNSIYSRMAEAEEAEKAERSGKTDNRFPTHLLPPLLSEYVEQAASALGCDAAYIATPMLAAVASAIGNTRRIRLKPTWTEPAVIWSAVVGESGTVKSPALELALRPIWRHQRAALKAHAAAWAQYKTELSNWNKQKKSDRGPEPDRPDPCEHSICLDITIEALADRLLATPRGTLVAPDELAGWFGSFNQYKAGGADVAHWLSLFGARSLKVDRKTGDRQTIYVPRAAVSVTGTIQPETLRRVLTPEFFGNGLTARILLVMPDHCSRKWSDREINPITDQAITQLFENLFKLKPVPGVEGEDEPLLLDLTPEALVDWVHFVNQHGKDMDCMDSNQRAAYSKLEAYAARFALIFHCINTATGEESTDYITPDDIANGITLVKWFWTQTQRIYHGLWRSEEERADDELINIIKRKGGTITIRELQRGPVKYRATGAAIDALQELVEAGKGEWFFPPTQEAGGKPIASFRLLEPAGG